MEGQEVRVANAISSASMYGCMAAWPPEQLGLVNDCSDPVSGSGAEVNLVLMQGQGRRK